MNQEFGPDLVTVLDEEGNQHQFELLDAIETDSGRYVAMIPYYENPQDMIDDDGELVILAVVEENGEDILVPIEDQDEFDEVANIFENRLSELYEIDVQDEEENQSDLN